MMNTSMDTESVSTMFFISVSSIKVSVHRGEAQSRVVVRSDIMFELFDNCVVPCQ